MIIEVKGVKKLKRFIKSTWPAATAMALAASGALAQENKININAPGGFASLEKLTPGGLVSTLIKLALVVAAVVFFFMLVIGGIKWILSGGDKGKTEEARNQITAALVGLVIVFAAWAIAKLIEQIFGVSILQLDISGLRAS